MKPIKDKSKITRVAVDTNILILMSAIDENFEPKRGKDSGFKDKIRIMKRKAINGSLQLVVTPTVLNEISKKITQKEQKFLQNYCYVVNPTDKQKYAFESMKLGIEYIRSGVMQKENGCASDALIMAESTVCGLNLVTGNTHHFIDYEPGEVEKGHSTSRAEDIQNLNKKLGYVFVNGKKERIVPKPCTPEYYFENFKNGKYALIEDKPEISYEKI